MAGEARICLDIPLDADSDGFYTDNDFYLFYYASLDCNTHLDWSTDELVAQNIVAIYDEYIGHFKTSFVVQEAAPNSVVCLETEVSGFPTPAGDVDPDLECVWYGDCGLRRVFGDELGRLPNPGEYLTPNTASDPDEPDPCDEEGDEENVPLICASTSPCEVISPPPGGGPFTDMLICSGAAPCVQPTTLDDILLTDPGPAPGPNTEQPGIPCSVPVSMEVQDPPECDPQPGSTHSDDDNDEAEEERVYAAAGGNSGNGDEDGSGSSGGGCGDTDGGSGTTSAEPVHLASGHKVMSVTDLRVPVTGPDFQLVRQYNSSTSLAGQSVVGNNQWLNVYQQVVESSGVVTHYGESPKASYEYVWNSGASRYGGDGPTTRYITETATEDWEDAGSPDVAVFRMVTPGAGTRDFYRAPGTSDKQVHSGLVGLLREVRDEYGNSQFYEYDIYGSNYASGGRARLKAIYINGTPLAGDWEAKVEFVYYVSTPSGNPALITSYHPLHGMLAMVRVYREDEGAEKMTQWVGYTYQSNDGGISDDAGSLRDLVMVSRFVSVDDSPTVGVADAGPVALPNDTAWRPFITQYRYHSSSEATSGGTPDSVVGRQGQLKTVIMPEQIEYAAQQRNRGGAGDPSWNVLRTALTLLAKTDTATVYGSGSPVTPVRVIDIAAKVIGYATSDSPFDDRVIEQFIQADCGCSGASQGKKISYAYTDGVTASTEWLTVELEETMWNGVDYSTPYRTMIYDMETLGAGQSTLYLRNSILQDDAVGAGGRRWITHFEYDAEGRVSERWMPSAVASRAAGVDPVSAPAVSAHGSGTGLVWLYQYDANHLRTHIYAQEGVRSDGLGKHLTLETIYDSRPEVFYLPVEQRRVRVSDATSTGSLGADDIEVTSFQYGLSDDTEYPTAIAWIKKSVEAETASENGPGSVTTYDMYHLYNNAGQCIWTRDAKGVLTKKDYEAITGRIVSRSVNVPAASFAWTSPTGDSLSTSGWGETTATPLTTSWTRTLRGQVRTITRPGGVMSRIYREYRPYEIAGEDPRPGIAYFVKTVLPHKLDASEAYGATYAGPAMVAVFNSAGQPIASVGIEVDGAATFPPDIASVSDDLDGLLGTGRTLHANQTDHVLSGLVGARHRYDHALAPSASEPVVYTTSFEYDMVGRLLRRTDAEQNVVEISSYDAKDRPLALDAGAVVGSSPALVRIADYYYDDPDTDALPEQGSGDGNLSWLVYHEDGTTTRPVRREYDFRNRLTAVVNPAPPHMLLEYDNLSRVASSEVHSDDAFVMGVFAPSLASRGARVENSYSQRGLLFRSGRFIDPSSASSGVLHTDRWFDERGDVIASQSPSGPVTKTRYDAFGRIEAVYSTDAIGSTYADASSVSSDTVLEQASIDYNTAIGLPDLLTRFIRPHDATAVGELDSTVAVAMYVGLGYDDANRPVRRVDFGTNQTGFATGSTAPSWPPAPGSLPDFDTSGFGDTRVAAIKYGEHGLATEQTDEEGRRAVFQYDDLMRMVVTIENYQDASAVFSTGLERFVASGITQGDMSATAFDRMGTDRVTSYYYDGLSRVVRTISHLGDSTGSESLQSTEYDYAARLTGAGLPSAIDSNGVLSRIRFPNETTGLAAQSTDPDVGDYSVTFAYNRLGELITSRDQNTTLHQFERDLAGRVTADEVTVATGIDDLIDKLMYSYDGFGRLAAASSLDTDTPSDPVVNEVGFEYDGLWRPTAFHQNVLGEVYSSPGLLDSTTETMSYGYETSTTGRGESRAYSMTYPDGSIRDFLYGTAGQLDDSLDRPKWIRISDSGGPGDILTQHTYMGAASQVQEWNFRSGTKMDRIMGPDGESASGSYSAFDRFGRLSEQTWHTGAFGQGSSLGDGIPSLPAIVAQVQTFDRVSNPLTRFDARTGVGTPGLDRVYEYDGLNRLAMVSTGTDANGDGTLVSGELDVGDMQYVFDHLGNWLEFRSDNNMNGSIDPGTSGETEVRTHNLANELSSRSTTTGSSPFQITTGDAYTYDLNGNLVESVPLGGTTTQFNYTYDAWNRLVNVEKETTTVTQSGTVVTVLPRGTYEYNALNHQTIRTADPEPNTAGPIERRRYYYTMDWQLAEEHIDDSYEDTSGFQLERIGQYYYGLSGIDDACYRRIDGDADGTYDGSEDSHWFLLRDLKGDVVAVLNGVGTLHERIRYDAWGTARHSWSEDFDGDGDVDAADLAYYPTASTFSIAITDTAYNADLDLDMDGDVDDSDRSEFNGRGYRSGLAAGIVSDPDGPDNSFGYSSYQFRPETGLALARHRHYSPMAGRWLSRDPLRYVDGFNQYEYGFASPVRYSDPTGLQNADSNGEERSSCSQAKSDAARATKKISDINKAKSHRGCASSDSHTGSSGPYSDTTIQAGESAATAAWLGLIGDDPVPTNYKHGGIVGVVRHPNAGKGLIARMAAQTGSAGQLSRGLYRYFGIVGHLVGGYSTGKHLMNQEYQAAAETGVGWVGGAVAGAIGGPLGAAAWGVGYGAGNALVDIAWTNIVDPAIQAGETNKTCQGLEAFQQAYQRRLDAAQKSIGTCCN